MSNEDGRIYLPELAKKLDRAEHTIRQVIREELLPKKLQPSREGGRRRLYWLEEQVPGLKKFFNDRIKNRGWPNSR